MEIITGKTAEPHIYSEDEGALYASIFGPGVYILPLGNRLSAELIDANTIRINSGEFIMNGRFGRIRPGEYDTVTIDNGAAGYARRDIIAVRYTMVNGIEAFNLVVIKGTPYPGEDTVTPDWDSESNIYNGDSVVEWPLYYVDIIGVSVNPPLPACDVLTGNLEKAVSLNANDEIAPPSDIVLNNSAKIFGMTTGDPLGSGSEIKLLGIQPCSEANNCVIGFGGYDAKIGKTNIYGDNVNVFSNGYIDLRGNIQKNGKDYIVTQDYDVTYNQEAGTIGTRFLDKQINVGKSGYYSMGVYLKDHGNNYYAMFTTHINGDTLHLCGYRANAASRSNQTVTVTVLYRAR